MPDSLGRPFARDIAERIGIPVSDFRARVSRRHAPEPVDYVEVPIGRVGKVVRPVWDPSVVDAYIKDREFRSDPKVSMQLSMARTIDCPHTDCDASARSWAEFNDHIRDEHRKVTA